MFQKKKMNDPFANYLLNFIIVFCKFYFANYVIEFWIEFWKKIYPIFSFFQILFRELFIKFWKKKIIWFFWVSNFVSRIIHWIFLCFQNLSFISRIIDSNLKNLEAIKILIKNCNIKITFWLKRDRIYLKFLIMSTFLFLNR